MRLTRVRCHSELTSILSDTLGQFVLTDAIFEGGSPETIRLNVTSDSCSFWRGTTVRDACPLNAFPFQVGNPSLLMSLEELRQWQDNFASVFDCIGPVTLGSIPSSDPANTTILRRLQAASRGLEHADQLLEELDVETSLYRIYQKKSSSYELFAGGQVAEDGRSLIEALRDAAQVYAQVPELRSYFADRTDRRVDDLGPRGQQFRDWFTCHPIQLPGGQHLSHVADELKPLHLSGREFRWNQSKGDLRLLSVDLLAESAGSPVWCEVKMKGDTWPTSAIVQVLLYGAMIAGTHQQQRLHRQFPNRFQATRPWLGVIVEDGDRLEHAADQRNAIEFCRHSDTTRVMCQFFSGIHFVTVAPNGDSWEAAMAETIPWSNG